MRIGVIGAMQMEIDNLKASLENQSTEVISGVEFVKGTLGGKGVNAGQNMYTFIHQQWNFYRNQAYAEAMMPTTDDMRNIKNQWNKLIPDWEEDKHFFSTIGKEEITYNDYYHGY